MDEQTESIVIPVVQEQVRVDVRPVQTGGVRVITQTHVTEQIFEHELRRTRAEVEHVPINRVVDGPQAPYQAGDTYVVPVVEEVVRVERSWILKEEIRIRQVEESGIDRQTVPVRHEEVRIERFDHTGNTIEAE